MVSFADLNALFDQLTMTGIGEILGFFFLCAKIYGGFWVAKTLFKAFTKK